MFASSDSYYDINSKEELNSTHKKALIMALGNTRDVSALLNLVKNEEDEDIIFVVVNVLAALCSTEAISYLDSLLRKDNISNKLRASINIALELIHSSSEY